MWLITLEFAGEDPRRGIVTLPQVQVTRYASSTTVGAHQSDTEIKLTERGTDKNAFRRCII